MATNTAHSTGRGFEWLRDEGAVWREQDTFDGYRERIRAARVGDLSRVALGSDHESACGYCYLGAAHTMDFHAARVEAGGVR